MPPLDQAAQDTQRGRSDPPDRLSARLATAPAAYLEGALENPALEISHLVLLLRNSRASSEILNRIGTDERARRHRTVRLGLATHPSSSRPLATRMLGLLGWRDLIRALDEPRTPATMKRQALLLLAERIDGLALGEKVSLARIAPRGAIATLLPQRDSSVIGALLSNPRLMEQDVLALARRPGRGGAPQGLIARKDRWSRFPAVRWAVIENPSTQPADALYCLRRMSAAERRRVADHPGVPRLVRLAAERSLRNPEKSTARKRDV